MSVKSPLGLVLYCYLNMLTINKTYLILSYLILPSHGGNRKIFEVMISIDTILCVLLTMPVASATAEISFSVLIRLKTYVRSTMENDRLSSLGLMHIHRDFEIDLYKTMEVFVSVRTRRTDLGHFKKFLSIKVIKIVLDSILYETLKWPQIVPFCISSKKNL